MKLLELLLYPGPVSEAPGETLVAFIPEDERPLRGDVGMVDWRLCGALSHELISGFVTGAADEVVLLPLEGPFEARRVLTVGLGPCEKIPGRALRRATAFVLFAAERRWRRFRRDDWWCGWVLSYWELAGGTRRRKRFARCHGP